MPSLLDLVSERRTLLGQPGLTGWALCRAWSDLVDRWLAGLLGEEPDVAVVAVGGYGRRELFPGSDLDVVLVHRGGRRVGTVAERLWYPIWDAHLALDHSVRTLREALTAAQGDLKVAMGLLDARLVAGDAEMAGDLAARARRQWRDTARRWLPVLGRLGEERHAREGEVAFLLEPDLKEGKGGLRDLSALRAAHLATPILPDDDRALVPAAASLARARVELHRQTGRPSDRLLLQEQDGVAAALGCTDADALMGEVAAAARTIAWASDDAWWRIGSWLAGPRGRVVGPDRPLGPGLVLRDGEVEVGEQRTLSDPSLVVRAAAEAARAGTRLSRAALETLATAAALPGDPWPPSALQALVSLLGAGPAAVPVLEALDQRGLLVGLLPEWEPVRSRPQRNAYHRYTVDRHLMEAAVQAASLVRRVARPDLLLVGAFLHDLGKGYPGDHSDAGVELITRVAPRLGFPPEDVLVLAALVRHHLLLAEVATRRDLSDPATVAAVAQAVGDRPTLDLLAALTEADSKATGESAWSSWKAGLVAALVERVGAVLAGQVPPPGRHLPTDHHRRLMARAAGGWLMEAHETMVAVIAPDHPGVFSLVTGVLALEGLTVLSADAWSGDGVALSELVVEPEMGGQPDWARVEARLLEMADRPQTLEAALARRAADYSRGRRPRAASTPGPCLVTNLSASATATVVEVMAPDSVGLLHRITKVLAGLGLDIRHAKVSTLGHEVVDTFYLTDSTGHKVTDPVALAGLEHAVLAELA